MVDAKWCDENLNSGRIRFINILSEVKELFDARSLYEVQEEIGDVLYFTYCWLYSKYGINLPMIGAMGSVRKYYDRLEVWEEIFKDRELKFDRKYLVNGSNYRRLEKVTSALNLAKKDQRGDSDV